MCAIGQIPRTDGPLRIALVHVADCGHGAERAVMTLHKSLLALGYQSRLFVGTKSTDEPEVYEIRRDRPIPGLLRVTRWLEDRLGWQNLYAPWFRSLHRVLGPDVDVVHLHSLWTMSHAFADLTGITRLSHHYPSVMTLHDGWMLTGHCACPIGCDRWRTGCGRCPDLIRQPAVPKDVTAWNWKRKRRAIRRASLHVTTVSHWMQEQVRQSPIFADKPVDVVHNSVDTSVFHPSSQQEARLALGVPQDRFVVLLAGQAIEGIRQGIAQHAIHALNQMNDGRILALLVGHAAQDVAATLRTPTLVLPYQRTAVEMARCYRAADVTVVPSEYETFGLIGAESLCCGTPVIAFATGGLNDVVTLGRGGWLVPTGDVGALARAIQNCFERPDELTAVRRVCAVAAAAQFATRQTAEDYVRIYRQVLAEREATGRRAVRRARDSSSL